MSFHRRIAVFCTLGLGLATPAHAQHHRAPGAGFSVVSWQFHRRPCKDVASIALGAYYFDDGQCAPGDASAVLRFRAQTGRSPAVWMIFQSWTGWNKFPAEQAKRARALGSTLMVTWEPWNGAPGAANWGCEDIVMGKRDEFIRSYARQVKAAGTPVLIRFAHEMNGDWYPWATAYRGVAKRTGDNSPAMYCAMWKHVVNIFRHEGALNARWVWSPNILYTNQFNDERTQERDLCALFPGDEWVDWVGVSVYNDGAHGAWRSFTNLFESTYNALGRLSNRPLMIAELGVTEEGAPDGQTKARWLERALLTDIPNRFSRVRLVTYFCRDKTAQGESNFRFDSSPAALAAFRQAAQSPIYAGAIQ